MNRLACGGGWRASPAAPPGAPLLGPPATAARRRGFRRAPVCSSESGRNQAAALDLEVPCLQRCTIGAAQAVHQAEEEARRLALRAAGEEHLLLGLLGQRTGAAQGPTFCCLFGADADYGLGSGGLGPCAVQRH